MLQLENTPGHVGDGGWSDTYDGSLDQAVDQLIGDAGWDDTDSGDDAPPAQSDQTR